MILMLVAGIAGARIFYIAQNFGYYRLNPYEMLSLSKGGLVWYGAFIAGFGSAAAYIRIKRMDFWASLDLAAPYIALAQALGRIGCFMNGCCYGVTMPDGALHPTQLYSAAALLCIFVILRIWQEHRHFKGEIFLGYCAIYSIKRFVLEFMRGDNPGIFLGFTISQVISLVVFVFSVGILITMAATWKKRR